MNSSENHKVWVDMGFDFDKNRKLLAELGNEKDKLRDEIIS